MPRERVLIVCEGEKTEPYYFSEMARDLGLSGTDVRVCGDACGSDPLSVVRFAIKAARDDSAFDHVFCVVDKDSHPRLAEALGLVGGTKLRGVATFALILSVPCFEYWILIHFEPCSKPFSSKGRLSVGGVCLKEVQRHFPDYEKARKDVYSALKDRLPQAINNAKRRHAECCQSGTDNPSTQVHRIVELLRKIARDASGSK